MGHGNLKSDGKSTHDNGQTRIRAIAVTTDKLSFARQLMGFLIATKSVNRLDIFGAGTK